MAKAAITAILYGIEGHLHTTYCVAKIVGLPEERALELALGSQVPDEKFSATWAVFQQWVSSTGVDIMRILHSFHGGEEAAVLKRRLDLRLLIAASMKNGEPAWKIGLMNHAYADAYAHTTTESGSLKAYGRVIGHAHNGTEPDKIALYPDKYLEYIGDLYLALGGRGTPEIELAGLRDIILKNVGKPGQVRLVEQGIKAYAAKLGLDENALPHSLEKLTDRVSRDDLVATLNDMKNWIARG